MSTALVLIALSSVNADPVAESPHVISHAVVFQEKGRFAGWPANEGCWSWGDEIVVGFTLGFYKDNERGGHPIDRDRGREKRLARSVDGGETWSIETPSYNAEEQGEDAEAPQPPGGVDFTHPDFAARFKGSYFYYSNDRCRTWNGPYQLPLFGREKLLARTDYIVRGKHDLMAFMAATKDDGQEGWTFCLRTTDGGETWQQVGWIGREPEEGGYAIMPSTVAIGDNAFLSMIRRRERLGGGKSRWWVEGWLSPDLGYNWYLLKEPTIENHGNPPHMIRLEDQRLALTYGHREAPYGIRARLSRSDGKTWGEEIILRADAGGWDIGYPRTVQRADGKLVTMYYYWDEQTGDERYIASTLWNPFLASE
jgi:hypothetical protein